MPRPSRTCALVRVPKPPTVHNYLPATEKLFDSGLQSSHCQVHVGFRCLYHCLLHPKKYSFLMSIDEIIFDIFSKFGLGAQVLSLNGFFLLILKESHGGKNLSYVTMLLICF